MENELTDICGFSMGAPELRQCIKDRCRFWLSTEALIKEMTTDCMDAGISQEDIETESDKIRDYFGEGCCMFEMESPEIS